MGHTESPQAETTQTTTSSHTSKRAPKKSNRALLGSPFAAQAIAVQDELGFAPAHTHGDQAIALGQAAQRVCQLGDEDDSGGSHRVAVRHGAA